MDGWMDGVGGDCDGDDGGGGGVYSWQQEVMEAFQ